jgi:hypothetical protein
MYWFLLSFSGSFGNFFCYCINVVGLLVVFVPQVAFQGLLESGSGEYKMSELGFIG